MEIKDIKGFEGKYAACSDGNIWSHWLKDIMSLQQHSDKRLFVGLFKDGKQKQYQVARIIAETFIPNPLGLPEVNHRDEDVTNNSVDNLEWCDRTYNCNYGTRNERIIETRKATNPNGECYQKTVNTRTLKGCSNAEKKVSQYSLKGEYIETYISLSQAEKETGCRRDHIRRCIRGELKQTGGFIWKFGDQQ